MHGFRSTIIRGAVFGLALLAAGCEKNPTDRAPLSGLPRALTAAEKEVVGASNRFAFALLRQVGREQPEENVFLSPLSASMALGMAMNGARGETFEQMRSTLGFGALPQPQINESYRSLIDLLLGLDRGVDMRVANSIWFRRDVPFEKSFFDTTRKYFDAEVAGLDFADPKSVKTINAWVDRSTNGKIPDIVETIRPSDVMFLINAIYFKGSWTQQFSKEQTRDDHFTTAGGERVPVKMMNREGSVLHLRAPGFQAVDLPYGGGAFSMTILLPDPGRDVDALLASLDAQRWQELTGQFAEQRLHLALPRFRLEYRKELVRTLKALGMEVPFLPRAADFTGMSAAHGRDLFISNVLQKTFVDVNEEGTEAAAVTKVAVGIVSAPPSVRVDRPFLVAIRERFSGTILFLGIIAEPPAS